MSQLLYEALPVAREKWVSERSRHLLCFVTRWADPCGADKQSPLHFRALGGSPTVASRRRLSCVDQANGPGGIICSCAYKLAYAIDGPIALPRQSPRCGAFISRCLSPIGVAASRLMQDPGWNNGLRGLGPRRPRAVIGADVPPSLSNEACAGGRARPPTFQRRQATTVKPNPCSKSTLHVSISLSSLCSSCTQGSHVPLSQPMPTMPTSPIV
jgi:hypothetical protein